MMENDDRLIQRFMQANKREVADNGFTRRVIRRLPRRAEWWSNVLTFVCTLLCCVLFYVYDGFGLLLRALTDFIATQSYVLASGGGISLPSFLIAAVVLITIGTHRLLSHSDFR